MKIASVIGLAVTACQLAACGMVPLSSVKPVPKGDVHRVLAEIKRQLSVYTAFQNSPYGLAKIEREAGPRNCGNGRVGFDIAGAAAELSYELSTTLDAGIDIGPIPSAAVSGNLEGSRNTIATAVLKTTYEVVPSDHPTPFKPEMLENAPLAVSLINLQFGSIEAGRDPSNVCIRLDTTAADSNYVQIGISVVDYGKAGVKLGVSNIGLSANGEFKSTTGNTIVVKFKPHDFGDGNPQYHTYFQTTRFKRGALKPTNGDGWHRVD